jgi:TPR repeat protein
LTKRKAQKARKNDGETLFNIGCDYYNNKKDYSKAFPWFYKAALENHSNAQNNIGKMYQHGQGVSQYYKLAMEWYQEEVTKGNVNAQNNIDFLYENNYGITKDIGIAIKWYTKAADNNSEEANKPLERLNKQRNHAKEEHKGSIC